MNAPVSHQQANEQIAAAERENEEFKHRTVKVLREFNSVAVNQGKDR